MKRLRLLTRILGRWPHLSAALAALLTLSAVYYTEKQMAADTAVSAAPPLQFSPPGGYYERGLQVELSTPQPNVDICYSLDGRIPGYDTGVCKPHSIRLNVAAPTVAVVRARLFRQDNHQPLGTVVTASYVVGLDSARLPVLSLAIDPDDFVGNSRGIYTNFSRRGPDWERPVDVTYFDKDRRMGFQVPAGLRIHGNWTRTFFDKKSFRLYFRRQYGAGRLNYPLFDAEKTTFDRLVLHNSGLDLLLMKNQLVANLAWQSGGHAARGRPVLLFINGQSWGIYYVRERIDDDFLAGNYGILDSDILDTPDNVEQQTIVAGDRAHWDHLMRFVATHDLAEPVAYAYIQSQIDLANFIDYTILQIYAADTDWPEYNVHQFRSRTNGGRWQWLFWDNDFSFEKVDRQVLPDIMKSDQPLGPHTALLLRKLLANPEFVERFLTRTADLLNTYLAPAAVIDQFDHLVEELESDITFEMDRWAIDLTWSDRVQGVRDFAQRRPDVVRQEIVEILDWPGAAQINFDVAENTTIFGGQVIINGMPPQTLPWSGVYFQDIMIRVTAVPPPGYRFVGWEGLDTTATPSLDLIVSAEQTLTPIFIPVREDELKSGDAIISQYHVADRAESLTEIEGDWIELTVLRPGGLDLRVGA